jgi:hypothetical protein
MKVKPAVVVGAGAPNPPKAAVEVAGAPNPPKAVISNDSKMRKRIVEIIEKI